MSVNRLDTSSFFGLTNWLMVLIILSIKMQLIALSCGSSAHEI